MSILNANRQEKVIQNSTIGPGYPRRRLARRALPENRRRPVRHLARGVAVGKAAGGLAHADEHVPRAGFLRAGEGSCGREGIFSVHFAAS